MEAHLDEVIFDREADKVVVGQRLRTLPHAGLVRVPVVAPFHDFGLELREDDLERLDGVLLWCMGRIECKHFVGCYWEICYQWRGRQCTAQCVPAVVVDSVWV